MNHPWLLRITAILIISLGLAWLLRPRQRQDVLERSPRIEQAARQSVRQSGVPSDLKKPELESELRRIDEQLGQASLDAFRRESDRSLLEDQARQASERQAEIESQLTQEASELAEARRLRDASAQAILNARAWNDVREQVRQIESERMVQELSGRLEEQARALAMLEAKLRSLEEQNYDSDELRRAREEARVSRQQYDQLSNDLDLARLESRIATQNQQEARDWSQSQAQADLYQEFEEQRRSIQQRYTALRGELSTLQSQAEQRRQKLATLDEEQKSSEQVISGLVAARDRVLQRLLQEEAPPSQRLQVSPGRPS